MKTLLSLFDYSGNWSRPFLESGEWEVIRWDIKIDKFLDIKNLDSCETCLEILGLDIDGILAAPPCTDFAVSGAQYWKIKDANGNTEKSLELVRQVLRLVDLYRPTDPDYDGTFFWCMENPVGRIPKFFPELGKPLIIEPYEYAGWNELNTKELLRLKQIARKEYKDITAEEAEFVLKCEAYTKKTCLWGEFNRELLIKFKKPIQPIKVCKQGSPLQRLGGKNETTKEKRSFTPNGFARAFFEANKNYKPPNDEYYKAFGIYRYSDYDSFRRRLKKIINND